ncbi:MAG: hypothetical protein WC068_05075 [Caulobacter sp.]
MTFELNGGKLLGLFAPIWALLALSWLVNPAAWVADPVNVALAAGIPFAASGLLWAFGRRRWRLELTPTALIHHTLGRTEVFDWALTGPIGVSRVFGLDLVSPSTLHFAYAGGGPTGKVLGRRLLCVFGDGGTDRLLRQIEDYRRLHGA